MSERAVQFEKMTFFPAPVIYINAHSGRSMECQAKAGTDMKLTLIINQTENLKQQK